MDVSHETLLISVVLHGWDGSVLSVHGSSRFSNPAATMAPVMIIWSKIVVVILVFRYTVQMVNMEGLRSWAGAYFISLSHAFLSSVSRLLYMCVIQISDWFP